MIKQASIDPMIRQIRAESEKLARELAQMAHEPQPDPTHGERVAREAYVARLETLIAEMDQLARETRH